MRSTSQDFMRKSLALSARYSVARPVRCFIVGLDWDVHKECPYIRECRGGDVIAYDFLVGEYPFGRPRVPDAAATFSSGTSLRNSARVITTSRVSPLFLISATTRLSTTLSLFTSSGSTS